MIILSKKQFIDLLTSEIKMFPLTGTASSFSHVPKIKFESDGMNNEY